MNTRLLCTLAAALTASSLAAQVLPKSPGVHRGSFKAEGLELRYSVDVPDVDAAEPRPLVLALHYGFDSSRPFPSHYGEAFMERVVAPGLRRLGAYIVAPDSHGMGWGDPKIAGPVLGLLDRLAADPRVDGGKLIVTGYSMGGAGTWFFAAEHGARFAAAVPMAGRLRPEWIDAVGDLPVHVLHSRNDELIAHDAVREIVDNRGKASILFTSLNGITHFESQRYAGPLDEVVVPWLQEQVFAESVDPPAPVPGPGG